jgi:hypothetical protein
MRDRVRRRDFRQIHVRGGLSFVALVALILGAYNHLQKRRSYFLERVDYFEHKLARVYSLTVSTDQEFVINV